MEKPSAHVLPAMRLKCFFVATMVFLLQFQAFAYKPAIVTYTMPEAVADSFYQAQLLAEGFGKNAVWGAEGLPRGLDINPDTGIISGIPENPGVFEFAVTVKGWIKWRMWADSKLFQLKVSPKAADEPAISVPPVEPVTPSLPEGNTPSLLPQSEANIQSAQGLDAPQDDRIVWLRLWANGESMLETTKELYLDFSREIMIFNALGDDAKELVTINSGAVEIVSLSKEENDNGCATYVLGISIDESFEDGGKIELEIDPDQFGDIDEFSPESDLKKTVNLHVASGDYIKAKFESDALTLDRILPSGMDAEAVTGDLTLPVAGTVYDDCVISWKSSDQNIISDEGEATRPAYGEEDKEVTLTAEIRCNEKIITKDFYFTVKSLPEPQIEPPPEIPPEIPPENPPENSPEIPPESQPEIPPEIPSGILPEIFPDPIPSITTSSNSKSSQEKRGRDSATNTRTSSNVDKNGAVSRTSVTSEFKAALDEAEGEKVVVKAQNAASISSKTLKALAAAAGASGKKAVLYADTLTEKGGVDARLYLKPAELNDFTGEVKLGISTRNRRAEKTKRYFEKHFDNKISIISCEQQGEFGARLQIAAKVKLPENAGNLVFYSYDSQNNKFSRIITAYRVDANGYLRFATKKAGDIIVSDGPLRRK